MMPQSVNLAVSEPANQPARMPENIEAEQALIGAILVNAAAYERVAETLDHTHFAEPVHGMLFEAIGQLMAANRVATPISLAAHVVNWEPISPTMTVAQYLGRLAANATTIMNARDYGRTIRDLAMRRALIQVGTDLVQSSVDAAIDIAPADLIEDAEAALYAVAEKRSGATGIVTMAEAAELAAKSASAAHKSGGTSGIRTGLADLDHRLGGLHPSDLIIIAGRPSMGKTALVTNMACNVARSGIETIDSDGQVTKRPAPVLFFSLEMSAEQLAHRITAEAAEVSGHDVRTGRAEMHEVEAYIRATGVVGKLPIHIDQTGGIGIAQLTARARRMKRRHGAALVVVDYIQIMQGAGQRGGNRVQELGDITTGLKALAKELEVPVIALSQLSRNVESRDNKRPQLSDLRESGSIEQDADVVMFVYREEYYVERGKPDPGDVSAYSDWEGKMRACAGKAEVIIGKQRHGPLGVVDLAFDGRFTRFGNLARGEGPHV